MTTPPGLTLENQGSEDQSNLESCHVRKGSCLWPRTISVAVNGLLSLPQMTWYPRRQHGLCLSLFSIWARCRRKRYRTNKTKESNQKHIHVSQGVYFPVVLSIPAVWCGPPWFSPSSPVPVINAPKTQRRLFRCPKYQVRSEPSTSDELEQSKEQKHTKKPQLHAPNTIHTLHRTRWSLSTWATVVLHASVPSVSAEWPMRWEWDA